MRCITAPTQYIKQPNEISLFLAGAIDNGKAVMWQNDVIEQLEGVEDLLILNPRRKDWDPTWNCTKDNPQFVEQVNWEIDGINSSELTLMFLPTNSIAPVSLLELGLIATQHCDSLFVVCEDGYHRKGNVDIVCERYGVKQFETLGKAIQHIKSLNLLSLSHHNGFFLEE